MHLKKFEINDTVFFSPADLRNRFKIFFAFTSRKGGQSGPPFNCLNLASHVGDTPRDVCMNRKRILGISGITNNDALITVNQVHGNNIFTADKKPIKNTNLKNKKIDELLTNNSNDILKYLKPSEEGDGIITSKSMLAIMVMGADCNLILIADVKNRVIAAVHAGWRGVLNDILTRALNELCSNFNSRKEDIILYMGPSIRQCCFKVSPDLYETFCKKYGRNLITDYRKNNKIIKYHIDLPFLLKNDALKFGIADGNIHDLNLCTCCSEDLFFSYRRDKITGRQGAIAFIEK